MNYLKQLFYGVCALSMAFGLYASEAKTEAAAVSTAAVATDSTSRQARDILFPHLESASGSRLTMEQVRGSVSLLNVRFPYVSSRDEIRMAELEEINLTEYRRKIEKRLGVRIGFRLPEGAELNNFIMYFNGLDKSTKNDWLKWGILTHYPSLIDFSLKYNASAEDSIIEDILTQQERNNIAGADISLMNMYKIYLEWGCKYNFPIFVAFGLKGNRDFKAMYNPNENPLNLALLNAFCMHPYYSGPRDESRRRLLGCNSVTIMKMLSVADTDPTIVPATGMFNTLEKAVEEQDGMSSFWLIPLLAQAVKDKGDDINSYGSLTSGGPFFCSVKYNNIGALATLVRFKAFMYARGGEKRNYPLEIAIAQCNIPVIQLLLAARCKIYGYYSPANNRDPFDTAFMCIYLSAKSEGFNTEENKEDYYRTYLESRAGEGPLTNTDLLVFKRVYCLGLLLEHADQLIENAKDTQALMTDLRDKAHQKLLELSRDNKWLTDFIQNKKFRRDALEEYREEYEIPSRHHSEVLKTIKPSGNAFSGLVWRQAGIGKKKSNISYGVMRAMEPDKDKATPVMAALLAPRSTLPSKHKKLTIKQRPAGSAAATASSASSSSSSSSRSFSHPLLTHLSSPPASVASATAAAAADASRRGQKRRGDDLELRDAHKKPRGKD